MATTTTTPSRTEPGGEPRVPQRKRSWGSRLLDSEGTAGWLFILPAVTGILIFTLVPILMALWVSFRDWNGITSPWASEFTGLENYQSLVTESGVQQRDFAIAVRNNFWYVLGVVPMQTTISFLLAVIVNQKFLRGKDFFRTSYYFPSITSSIAISLVFIFLFQRNGAINALLPIQDINWLGNPNGLFHNLLSLVGVDSAPGWLADPSVMGLSLWEWISGPSVTLMAIMILATWTTIGTMMLIFLAGLQNISPDVEEASRVDGASPRQHFFFVTLPLMKATLFFVLTIGIIGTWQVFDQIFVITAGEPQKTTVTLAYLVYREAFRNFGAGRAAAVSFLLFLIIMVFTYLQRRIVPPEEA